MTVRALQKSAAQTKMTMQLPTWSSFQVQRRSRTTLLLVLGAVVHVALQLHSSSQVRDECKVHSFGNDAPLQLEGSVDTKPWQLPDSVTSTWSQLQQSRMKAAVALRQRLPAAIRDVNVTEKAAVACRTVATQAARGCSTAASWGMRFKCWFQSRGVPFAQRAAHKLRNGSEVAFQHAKAVTQKAVGASNRTLVQVAEKSMPLLNHTIFNPTSWAVMATSTVPFVAPAQQLAPRRIEGLIIGAAVTFWWLLTASCEEGTLQAMNTQQKPRASFFDSKTVVLFLGVVLGACSVPLLKRGRRRLQDVHFDSARLERMRLALLPSSWRGADPPLFSQGAEPASTQAATPAIRQSKHRTP
mmetsp:Transcript_17439/g.31452  ORF Transcript_17439/g.31452 Transcript_17439/m.31452 type:complete len:356 (+) Transcript_17439:1-1068(+)